MSSKVADAKAEMKEYLKSRRKKKGESCIIYKPITITFEFTDDDLRRGQTDKRLLTETTRLADNHVTANRAGVGVGAKTTILGGDNLHTSKARGADVVTTRK